MYCMDSTLHCFVKKVKKVKKGKDVDLYSASHAPSTPNAHLRTAASRGLRCYCTPLVDFKVIVFFGIKYLENVAR